MIELSLTNNLSESYEIIPSAYVVNEGSAVSFSVRTRKVEEGTTIYYRVNGIDPEDLTPSLLNGTITINSGTANFSITLSNDLKTEGIETFYVELLAEEDGEVLARTETITVSDTSMEPTYAITANKTTYNEGEVATFTIVTENVPNSTSFYYLFQGTGINASDLQQGVSGTVSVVNGSATFTRTITADKTTEGTETFIVYVRQGNSSGPIVTQSAEITILDTSLGPTYSIQTNKTSYAEEETITVTITAANLTSARNVYLTYRGTGVSNTDFVDGSINQIVLVNNGTTTATKTLVGDLVTEGVESFVIDLKTTSNGTAVTSTGTITITEPTFTVSTNKATYNEGENITVTVNATNLPNEKSMFLTFEGTGVTANDFVDDTLHNQIVVKNGNTALVKTIKNDLSTEGAETFVVSLRKDSSTGSIVSSTISRSILDTSLNLTNTGPGPAGLLGLYRTPNNANRITGYFGTLSSSQFISGDALASAVGLQSKGVSQNSTTLWMKFYIDGKVVFIPRSPIRHSISWQEIYQAGCVYGDGTNGRNPSGTAVLQNRQVSIGGYTFKVSLLSGTASNPGIYNSAQGPDQISTHGSEWNRLFYNIVVPNAAYPQTSQEGADWASFTETLLGMDPNLTGLEGSNSWCKETSASSSTVRILRGYYSVTGISTDAANPYVNSKYGWRPKLELVI